MVVHIVAFHIPKEQWFFLFVVFFFGFFFVSFTFAERFGTEPGA
jgi:hypothetical protein